MIKLYKAVCLCNSAKIGEDGIQNKRNLGDSKFDFTYPCFLHIQMCVICILKIKYNVTIAVLEEAGFSEKISNDIFQAA